MNKVSLSALSKIEHRTLLKSGVPRNIFGLKPFLLDSAITPFTSEVNELKPKRISTSKQFDDLKKVLLNPFHSAYRLCITGKPNDNMAKMLAAVILNKANIHYVQALKKGGSTRSKILRQRSHPIWHTLTGSFQDELRDKRNEQKPALIVLANITKESSAVKKEKLRDILELYSAVPIVVLVAGSDPVTFFNEDLRHALNYAVLLCKSNVVKEHSI